MVLAVVVRFQCKCYSWARFKKKLLIGEPQVYKEEEQKVNDYVCSRVLFSLLSDTPPNSHTHTHTAVESIYASFYFYVCFYFYCVSFLFFPAVRTHQDEEVNTWIVPTDLIFYLTSVLFYLSSVFPFCGPLLCVTKSSSWLMISPS